jgi:hypothetical protein
MNRGCIKYPRSACLAVIFPGWARAQAVVQLKNELQQFERTMQDPPKQIAEVGQAQRPPRGPFFASTPPVSVPTIQTPTTAYYDQPTGTRVVANDDESGASRTSKEEIAPTLRGFFPLPGTGTLVRLGGFVKRDVFIDQTHAKATTEDMYRGRCS